MASADSGRRRGRGRGRGGRRGSGHQRVRGGPRGRFGSRGDAAGLTPAVRATGARERGVRVFAFVFAFAFAGRGGDVTIVDAARRIIAAVQAVPEPVSVCVCVCVSFSVSFWVPEFVSVPDAAPSPDSAGPAATNTHAAAALMRYDTH